MRQCASGFSLYAFLPAGCCAALLMMAPSVIAQEASDLSTVLAAHDRDIAHLLRDDSRKPAQVLQFMGIGEGMRVLDVYAADGYYTYLLSRLVGPTGQVYAQNPVAGTNIEDVRQMYSLADALDQRIAIAALDNVEHLREDFTQLTIAPASLDVVLLAQILHDFYNGDKAFAATLLSQFTALLKPGGVVAIIDHAGDAGQDNTRLHRMPKAAALELATAAGLQLVADSDLLTNLSDRRRRPVFDPMLGRNTDRFLLLLRKPEPDTTKR